MNKKNISLILLHLFLLFGVYFLFYKSGVMSVMPSNTSVIQWDAKWYASIKDSGYVYLPYRTCNMAFFPLFPALWKITFLKGPGISLINLGLFVFSFLFLIRRKELSKPELLLLISLPSFIFFSLPYSESLFFLCGTISILGIEKGNKATIIAGLAGCCLTRSVSVIFIPALIINAILQYKNTKHKPKAVVINTTVYCLVCLACLLLVGIIQYLQTGKWFYLFTIQKYWNRHLILPGLPFTTYLPERILGLDAVALLIGVLAIFFCTKWGIQYLRRSDNIKSLPETVSFSALYLSAVTILDVFFTNDQNGHGNLWSLNRHLFCTPFAIVFIAWFWKHYKPLRNEINIIYGLIFLFLFISGVYKYSIPLFYFICFSVFYIMIKFLPAVKKYGYGMYLINLLLEVILFSYFLNGSWVG